MTHPVDPSKMREITLAEKKQIMWNVIEPGDPYDIRKSMIAKLPGPRKFMGPHLELVCLLQAAEIQRLSLFLEEHRLKLRQQERVELDRHSYEIQIKELSEKILNEEGLRTENVKLKDFIRKQSKQLQDIQRSQNVVELTSRYEQSLRQVEQLVNQCHYLKQSLQTLQSQFSSSQQHLKREKERVEATQSNFKRERDAYEQRIAEKEKICCQLQQEKKQKLEQHMGTLKQYENRFYMLAEEIQRLNACLRDKSKELSEQNVKYQQLKDDRKESEELKREGQSKIKSLMAEVGTLQRQNRQILREKSSYEQRQTLIQQYESRIQKLSKEVDRLNSVLRKKLNELDEYRKRIRDQELTLSNYQVVERETDELRAKFSEVTKKIFEYQKQNSVHVHEIDRLNVTLKKMVDEINHTEVKLKNSERQVTTHLQKCLILETDRDQLTKTHSELDETNRELITQLRDENEHLKSKMVNLQTIYQENNVLRAELDQLTEEKIEERKKLIAQIQQYEQDIKVLRELNAKQPKAQQGEEPREEDLHMLRQQLSRVTSERMSLNDALNKLVSDNEALFDQNAENKRRVQQLGEYYKKVLIFSEQISRLNAVLQSKERLIEECNINLMEYRQKIKYFQENINSIQSQLQGSRKQQPRPEHEKTRQYETKINILEHQLGRSRQKDERIISYQNKITIIGGEIERLNNILKDKVQQIEYLTNENRNLKEELNRDGQIGSVEDKNNQIERLNLLIKQKEQALSRICQEGRRDGQSAELKKIVEKVARYEENIVQYKNQIGRLNKLLFSNSSQISSIEQKDKHYLVEIERLNNLLRMKIEESQQKGHQHRSYLDEIQALKDEINRERKEKEVANQHKEMFSQEIVRAKQQMHSYQSRIKELYDQFQRLQVVMKALREENQSAAKFKEEIEELISKNRWLGGEVDQLNQTIEMQTMELKDLRVSLADGSSLQRRVKEDLGLMVILFAEVESLRVRVADKDRELLQMKKSKVRQYRV